jgi:YidC/Oxa1 family membrane protein insertase
MDIRRTVLWVVFSLSLLLLWDGWMRHNGKQSMFFPTATQTAKPAAGGSAPATTASDVPQASAAKSTPAAVPATAAAQAQPRGEHITITTDVIKVDINTVGGQLERLELLTQKDTQDRTKNVVLFDATQNHTYLAQSGLIGGPFPNHKSVFVAKPGPRTLDGANQVQLVLESQEGGVKLTKLYTFKRGAYAIDIKHEVTNESGTPVNPSLYLQLVRDGSESPGQTRFSSTFTGMAVYTDEEKYQKLEFKKIAEGKGTHATSADNGWIAVVQHYFVSAFVPQDHAKREIFTKKIDNDLYAIGDILPLGTIAPGASKTMDATLYSGPQESSLLDQVAPGLDLVKDYGWLTIVAKPIFSLMTYIHRVLGNWGWTIIALTVLIKLVFFPLSAASYRSMAKMKTVTPKMTAIRERFKSDPQKMNQAMMELYKTEKINPLGGCLPIAIQIPVFLALYWVLSASVEMRNAPWIGWIHDLASPDPLYILPVLMAISMFVQTRLNPAPPDPVQAKVMMVMPLVFSAMFFFFPSGLVLYYVVNNLLSITQQWVITKKMSAPKKT